MTRGDILITSTYLQWEARRCPNENLGRRAHKNECGILLLCSDWREVSDRFSWDIAEAIVGVAVIVISTFVQASRWDISLKLANGAQINLFFTMVLSGRAPHRDKISSFSERLSNVYRHYSISFRQLSVWRTRCCPTATSERRRIRLKADYYFIALR